MAYQHEKSLSSIELQILTSGQGSVGGKALVECFGGSKGAKSTSFALVMELDDAGKIVRTWLNGESDAEKCFQRIWNGDYHTRCLIEGVGSCETTYTLTSDCVGGKRQIITVVYVGPGVGAGIPKFATSESSGAISFNDHQSDVSANSFNGAGGDLGVGFNVGTWGPSFNRTRLGKAYSTGSGGSQNFWVNIGATLTLGSSTVTDVRTEDCSCEK